MSYRGVDLESPFLRGEVDLFNRYGCFKEPAVSAVAQLRKGYCTGSKKPSSHSGMNRGGPAVREGVRLPSYF